MTTYVFKSVNNWLMTIGLLLLLTACGGANGFDEAPTDNGTAPSITALTISSSNANQGQAAVGDVVTITITSDEPILAPTVLINGNAVATLSGSGTAWVATYVITESDASGALDIVVRYSDLAGNQGVTATSTTDGSSISLDVDVPTVSLSTDAINAEAGVPFVVTITFSEAVSQFTVDDISASNASLSAFTGADGDAIYTVTVTPTVTASVDISVNEGAAIDVSGNTNALNTLNLNGLPEWTQVWADEFEGAALDLSKWNIQTGDGCSEGICGWGNNELQIYQNENITVSGGMLNLQARQETNGGYTSGRINTKNKLDIKYGRVEVRARLPEGQGTWPAIWMLSTDEVYGQWPLSGEIDIIEATNLGVNGKQTVTSTLHYGLPLPENTFTFSAYEPGFNPQDGFHIYALEWEANEIRFFVDGVHHATQISDNWYTYSIGSETVVPNTAPFDQQFHLLLNLAIGGNLPGAPDASSVFPQNYMIDYVRVFECANSDPANGEGCSSGDPSIVPIEALGSASVNKLEVYTDNAPATITYEAAGQSSTNTLQAGNFNAGGATIVSEFDFVDPRDSANTVWHVFIENDTANVFLSSEDKTGDELLDTGFDLMGGQNLGELIFDMKINALSVGTEMLIKMDSAFPNVGQVTLPAAVTASRDWQTVRVKISDLIANPAFVDCCGGTGLNLANVINLFVFEPFNPTTNPISVDVFFDNIRIEVACKTEGDCSAAPKAKPVSTLNVFDDAVGTTWDLGIGGFDDATGFASCFEGASCGDIVSWEVVNAADTARGQIIEFRHVEGTNFAGEFIQASAPQNLSAFDNGTLSFDINVVNAGNNTAGFVMKVDCVFPCTSGDQIIGNVGANGWETVTIPISQLIAGGLDTSNVNTGLVIFPITGQQSGVIYQIDNVFWNLEGTVGTPLSDNPPSAGVVIDGTVPAPSSNDLSIYTDAFAAGFSTNFFAADGTVNISEVDAADTNRGKVLQFESLASMQVSWIQADPALDLTNFSGGSLEFDLLVTQSPTDPTAFWQAKSECLGCTTIPELTVGGQTVITKDVWHTVSIDVSALAHTDITQVDKPLVLFPNWGKATDAIYQVDNVRFVPAAGTTPLSTDPSSAGITLNPTSSTSGGAEELVYADALSMGYEFGQFDNQFTGTSSIESVDSMDATFGNVVEINNGTSTEIVSWLGANPAKDLSAYSAGVLEFDLYIVDAPSDPTATWRMKVECTGCTATELTLGGQTLLPPGQWHHIVADVSALAITDMTQITNIVIFNDWTKAASSTYRIDNVVWKEEKNVAQSKVFFTETLDANYSYNQFDNQFTGTATMETVDSMDAAQGMVVEIKNGSSTEIVSWIGNSAAEDMSAYANGTLSFDFYVVVPPTDSTANYLVKIETEPCPAGCTATLEYNFGTQTSLPAGQWHSISIPMADLGISDITQFRNLVFFNEWTKAAGTVMQIDNVQFNP